MIHILRGSRGPLITAHSSIALLSMCHVEVDPEFLDPRESVWVGASAVQTCPRCAQRAESAAARRCMMHPGRTELAECAAEVISCVLGVRSAACIAARTLLVSIFPISARSALLL